MIERNVREEPMATPQQGEPVLFSRRTQASAIWPAARKAI